MDIETFEKKLNELELTKKRICKYGRSCLQWCY